MPDHIKSVDNPLVHGAVVLNPDGSMIGSSPGLPTGASTLAEQQTQTAHLAAIEAAVEGTLTVSGTVSVNEPVSIDDNGSSITIDATSLPLPTGASTLAEQQSQTAILTTIDTDTGSIATSAATIAGAVSGTEMQVDVLTMPTVAVTGTVSVNEPVSIDDNGGSLTIDASSLPLPTGASTAANQSTIISNLQTINSLTPSTYDYISLSYTGDNVTTVTYKTGGSGGTTVATLTLAYSGSNLTSVTRT